jgi:hypothetical protein
VIVNTFSPDSQRFFSRFPDEIENSRTTSQPKKKEKKRKEKKGRVPPMLVTVSLLTRLDM